MLLVLLLLLLCVVVSWMSALTWPKIFLFSCTSPVRSLSSLALPSQAMNHLILEMVLSPHHNLCILRSDEPAVSVRLAPYPPNYPQQARWSSSRPPPPEDVVPKLRETLAFHLEMEW